MDLSVWWWIEKWIYQEICENSSGTEKILYGFWFIWECGNIWGIFPEIQWITWTKQGPIHIENHNECIATAGEVIRDHKIELKISSQYDISLQTRYIPDICELLL